jgi:predicted TIM-barrel fold metal-dependent hydrolase
MWKHSVELERFLDLGLTDEENRMILQDNAKKFFER